MATNMNVIDGMRKDYNINFSAQKSMIDFAVPHTHGAIDLLEISIQSNPLINVDFGSHTWSELNIYYEIYY